MYSNFCFFVLHSGLFLQDCLKVHKLSLARSSMLLTYFFFHDYILYFRNSIYILKILLTQLSSSYYFFTHVKLILYSVSDYWSISCFLITFTHSDLLTLSFSDFFYRELMFRETFSVGIIRALCLKSHSPERKDLKFSSHGVMTTKGCFNHIFTSVVVFF